MVQKWIFIEYMFSLDHLVLGVHKIRMFTISTRTDNLTTQQMSRSPVGTSITNKTLLSSQISKKLRKSEHANPRAEQLEK